MNEEIGKRFVFRTIRPEEADLAAAMEQTCFPPHEACPYDLMVQRVLKDPEMFIVAEERETGKLCGMINGMPTDAEAFSDDSFTGFDLYQKDGKRMFLAGVEVLPAYRHQGLAQAMMKALAERERKKGRKELLLTCLEEKITFYEQMGYLDRGLSVSSWGNETWHEMTMDLEDETC